MKLWPPAFETKEVSVSLEDDSSMAREVLLSRFTNLQRPRSAGMEAHQGAQNAVIKGHITMHEESAPKEKKGWTGGQTRLIRSLGAPSSSAWQNTTHDASVPKSSVKTMYYCGDQCRREHVAREGAGRDNLRAHRSCLSRRQMWAPSNQC